MFHSSNRICALAAAAFAAAAASLWAERVPFERYQSVVDRQMFGDPPPDFDPNVPPDKVSAKDARAQEQQLSKEQEQVKSSVHFSMINVTPSGETAVGFTDNGDSKNPVHYYLKVGETRNGWTVKEADALAATMTIAKGDVEVSLSLGGNSAGDANATKSRSAGGAQMPSRGAFRSGNFGGVGGNPATGLDSIRGRRAARRAQEQESAERVAAEKARQEAEREAERQRIERLEQEKEEQRQMLLRLSEEVRRNNDESGKGESDGNAAQDSGGDSTGGE